VKVVVYGILVWLCLTLQTAIRPLADLPLVLLSVGGMLLPRSGATILGFLLGALHGALAGANLAGYAVSRTLAAFVTASAVGLGLQPSPWTAAIVSVVATVFAQTVFLFLCPPGSIPRFLGDTMGTAMYNGVLAVPVYALLRKVSAPTATPYGPA
jgi:rod shape-determining protein MreD